MTTVKNLFQQVIFERVTRLNGDNTEEELNMIISGIVANNKINNTRVCDSCNDCLNNITEVQAIEDVERVEPNGAWVYKYDTADNWVFERHDTIADAIRSAIDVIDADVICNGEIVMYDTLNETEAYYMDNVDDTIKLVKVG